ncbi:MAG: anti-sigma factor [Anaerolineales bacterium]
MAKTKHPLELLPAYALGSLREDERAHVAEHLQTCKACRQELAGYEKAVAQLALATPIQTAPAQLKQRLMQRARSQTGESRHERTAWWAALSARMPAYAALGVILIVGLTIANILLWRELQQQQTQSVALTSTMAITLDNTGKGDTGTGVLVISEDGRHATLIVEQLPKLSPQQQYQLWLIDADRLASAGVFSVGQEGYYALPVFSELPFDSYTAFGVSIEPLGGSQAPTGDIVLYKQHDA